MVLVDVALESFLIIPDLHHNEFSVFSEAIPYPYLGLS